MTITETLIRLCLPQLACAAILAAASIPAQETAVQLDPAQTKVEFTLADILHTVHGTFALQRGDMRWNPVTGEASGELVVNAASGDSGSNMRDHRMDANILQSKLFPEIVFRPDRIEGKLEPAGASQIQLHGLFIIHGAEHELTVPLDVQAGPDGYNATAHFSVPYVKWGMKNPSTLFLRVNDTVQITVHTVIHKTT